jgi:hypothetical protein
MLIRDAQGVTLNIDIDEVLDCFRRKGYEAVHFADGAAAAAYLNEQIDGRTVAFGDSGTLLKMGVYELLRTHNEVVDPVHPQDGKNFFETLPETRQAEIFLTSVNAATIHGELVNIDAVGNRVAGTLYGHGKVYFVFSVNKLCPTLDAAVWRARNVAAPQNAKRKGYKTPCAVHGDKCYNCQSVDRICNALVVHLHRMKNAEAEVVLIDEALGL